MARRFTLNLGMGFDSSFFLVDFLENSKSPFRQMGIEELVVISSQTGNESVLVKRQMEELIYPILRKHNIRTVQIARASDSLTDGFMVLDDTTQPTICYTRPTVEKPYWSLGNDLLVSAAVPQIVKGNRICSDKFKIQILDKWHTLHCPGCSRIIGFNADEGDRIAKDPCSEIIGFNADEGDRLARKESFVKLKKSRLGHLNIYPLYQYGYTRAMIEERMGDRFGKGNFSLSACTFCSFSQICGGGESVKERWDKYPDEAAEAAYIEYISICLNPRQTLHVGGKSVVQRKMLNATAVELFNHLIESATWKLYHVRRIRNIPTKGKKKQTDRSTRIISVGSRAEMEAALLSRASQGDLKYCHHGILRLHFDAPTDCEEFMVVAPGEPVEKQKNRFEGLWTERAFWALLG